MSSSPGGGIRPYKINENNFTYDDQRIQNDQNIDRPQSSHIKALKPILKTGSQ